MSPSDYEIGFLSFTDSKDTLLLKSNITFNITKHSFDKFALNIFQNCKDIRAITPVVAETNTSAVLPNSATNSPTTVPEGDSHLSVLLRE